jgi:peptidoglycan/LPS O-acetylase OafA/YrhL
MKELKGQRFESLDAFRGICAIAVVGFHLRMTGGFTEWPIFRGATIFVEFFFVLSGFVLTHTYLNKKTEFKDFFQKRLYRLYPLHLAMFLVMVVIELGKWFAYSYFDMSFNNIPFTNKYSLTEIPWNLLLLQSWIPDANLLSFNYPSWSISVEFYMYMILFFTITFIGRQRVLVWLGISALAFCLIIIAPNHYLYSAARGLACFFGGSLVYLVFRNTPKYDLSPFMATLIEVVLFAAIIAVTLHSSDYKRVLAALVFMVAVYVFAFERGHLSTLLKVAPMQLLGKLSYSIYMVHASILLVLTSVAAVATKLFSYTFEYTVGHTRFMDFGSTLANNLISLIIMLLVVGCSSVTYYHIELRFAKTAN